MGQIEDEVLRELFAEYGRRTQVPTRLYILGGSALLLLGNLRPTIDLDYFGDDLNKDASQLLLERLANELHIEIEAVPLDRFIPLPEGASTRHILIDRFDNLDVFIFDPYTIALSKIERGFDSDLDDIVFLARQGYIDLDFLAQLLDRALEQAKEFDLNPSTALKHFTIVHKRIKA